MVSMNQSSTSWGAQAGGSKAKAKPGTQQQNDQTTGKTVGTLGVGGKK